MAKEEFILTQDGLDKIEKELAYLKNEKRKEVAARIKEAISYGDISENSEYEDAKNEQAFIEGRIATLEKWLKNARLLKEEDQESDVVSLGDTVTIMDMDSGEEFEYTIVGTAEVNPSEYKISNESPVGKALLSKKIGDVVEVQVPAGLLKFKILDIQQANLGRK